MARASDEKRKAFYMYANYKSMIDRLSDDEAGLLIKAVYAFLEELNKRTLKDIDNIVVGEIDNHTVNIPYGAIADRMIIDYKKWLEECQKKKECGYKGGRPPKEKSD